MAQNMKKVKISAKLIVHSARTKEYVLGVGVRYSTYVAKKSALKPDNAPIHPAFKGFCKSEK